MEVPSILPRTLIDKLFLQMGKKWSDKKAKTTYLPENLGLQSKNRVTGKLSISRLYNEAGPRFRCPYLHFPGWSFQRYHWRRNLPYRFAGNQDGGDQNKTIKYSGLRVLEVDI